MIDNRLGFVALCTFWGGTWLAVKVTVTEIPPILVACVRAIPAGMVMLMLADLSQARRVIADSFWRVILIAFLTTTTNFAAVFWGTARLTTGVAAIVNNAFVPIGMVIFGALLKEDSISRRQLLGIFFGVVGLGFLFGRRTGESFDISGMAGLVANILGTLAYCLGSVVARPILKSTSPMTLGGLQMVVGGILLIPIVILSEPSSSTQFAAILNPIPLLGFAWMILAGGVGATFIYLKLIRDWGPVRAGMYSFVTPIIATLLGVVFLEERFGVLELLGACILLSAAALVLPNKDRIRFAN